MRFSVVLYWDEETQAWTAEVPAMDGAATCGTTVEEALEMARDLIALNVVDMRECGEPIPAESVPVQLHTVEVSEADFATVVTLPHEPNSAGPTQK